MRPGGFGAIARFHGAVVVAAAVVGCQAPPNQYVPPPPPAVTIRQPVQQEVQDFYELSGWTAGVEEVELRARVEGFVEQIHFAPGQRVEAGQTLFTIDQRPFRARVQQAEADLASKEATAELARINLERAQRLFERNQAADIEVREREADSKSAQAAVDLAKARLESEQLNLDYTVVQSPINGRVSRNLVDVGALVGAGSPTLLATVVNDSSIYAYIDVSERDVLQYMKENPDPGKRDQRERALLAHLATAADGDEFPYTGKYDSAENQLDASTGTLRLRTIFPNDDGRLFPGLFVRVRLPRQTRSAVLVPDVAVNSDQAGRFVLVVNKENVVERRNVSVGRVIDRMRVVDDGLGADEWVVVNGVQRARPGAKVDPQRQSAS